MYLNYAYLFINFLCLFWLGWHMFLLSGRSESTCVVHVGGAASLYYFRRIVHLDFVFRPRKLHIVFIYYFYSYHANIIYRCISLVFAPYGLSVLVFQMAVDLSLRARNRSAWTCWWQSPCNRDRYGKKVRNLKSPVSAEEPSGYFCYTPSLFFIIIYLFFLFWFYIFFYKLRACIYKFLLLVCICHRPFHHYQYYSLYIFK